MEAEGVGASGFRDIRTPSGGSILTSFLPRPGVSWNAAAERQVLGSTQHPGHSLFLAKAVWALEQCSPSACAESLVGGAPHHDQQPKRLRNEYRLVRQREQEAMRPSSKLRVVRNTLRTSSSRSQVQGRTSPPAIPRAWLTDCANAELQP